MHPDPQTWVEALEAIFLTVERTSRPNADGTLKTMTDTAKVAIATCRLNSVARDWWNTFKLDEAGIDATHDWRKFSKELLAELQPADIKERYHNQYLATKFTGHPGHYATQLFSTCSTTHWPKCASFGYFAESTCQKVHRWSQGSRSEVSPRGLCEDGF